MKLIKMAAMAIFLTLFAQNGLNASDSGDHCAKSVDYFKDLYIELQALILTINSSLTQKKAQMEVLGREIAQIEAKVIWLNRLMDTLEAKHDSPDEKFLALKELLTRFINDHEYKTCLSDDTALELDNNSLMPYSDIEGYILNFYLSIINQLGSMPEGAMSMY